MAYARKVDSSQQDIVDGLRKMGVRVWIIGWPCDLLLLYWSNLHQTFRLGTMECKTPTKTGKRRKRKDQADQDLFLEDTETPVVLSLDEAIAWLRNN